MSAGLGERFHAARRCETSCSSSFILLSGVVPALGGSFARSPVSMFGA